MTHIIDGPGAWEYTVSMNTIDQADLGHLYRYQDHAWHAYDYDRERTYGPVQVEICCLDFVILKETPQGCWIDNDGNKRFVLNSAHRKYACRTKAEALDSYIARKKNQVRIVKEKLEAAEKALALAQQEKGQQ